MRMGWCRNGVEENDKEEGRMRRRKIERAGLLVAHSYQPIP
jgi:hypothetical protein